MNLLTQLLGLENVATLLADTSDDQEKEDGFLNDLIEAETALGGSSAAVESLETLLVPAEFNQLDLDGDDEISQEEVAVLLLESQRELFDLIQGEESDSSDATASSSSLNALLGGSAYVEAAALGATLETYDPSIQKALLATSTPNPFENDGGDMGQTLTSFETLLTQSGFNTKA
ncbi:MAG: hypothetical protein HQL52_19955 [Magnetococcales bacterium]|nr:hypothetical protein [Magnetococcales bacterium]